MGGTATTAERGADAPVRTLPHVLAAQSAAIGSRTAVVAPDGELTYSGLFEGARRVAGGIAEAGIGRGDRVLTLLDNHCDFVLVWAGLSLANVVGVPANTAYKGTMLAHVVRDSGARALVVEARYLPRIAEIADQLPDVERIFVRAGVDAGAAAAPVASEPLSALLEAPPAAPADVEESDVMQILYTSGTTGRSKGVLIAQRHMHAYCVPDRIGAALPEDRMWVGLPLFHAGGQWGLYNALIAGATAVVAEQFSATRFWDEIRAHGCTVTLLLGAMARFLLNQPAAEGDSDNPLERVLLVPVVDEFAQLERRFGVEVGTVYGSTEAGNVLVGPFGGAVANGCGRPRDGVEVRLVDEHDEECAPGDVGELIVRAREPWELMIGYHGLAQATADAFRNGWFHTGDLFRRLPDGEYVFVDRKKDALRRRGENVSSQEVEREVLDHPAIEACAVVGVPSEDSEDEIYLAAVAAPGATASEPDLLLHLADRLPYFMVPRYIELFDDLPTTPSQKIAKATLRERPVAETAWDSVRAGFRVRRDGVEVPADGGRPRL